MRVVVVIFRGDRKCDCDKVLAAGRPGGCTRPRWMAGGQRWLVAGYGPANWVRNTRASGEVTLSRGGRSETYWGEEAGAEDAVPVLRKYIAEIRVTRPTSTPGRTQPMRPLRQNSRDTPSSG